MTLPKRTRKPHDRLTRICDVAVDAIVDHPENRKDVRAIILLSDEDGGGLVFHGYEDDLDGVVDLIVHLKAILAANGKQMQIHALPGRG